MSGLNLVQVAVEAESAGRQSGQNGPSEPTLVGRHAQALDEGSVAYPTT